MSDPLGLASLVNRFYMQPTTQGAWS